MMAEISWQRPEWPCASLNVAELVFGPSSHFVDGGVWQIRCAGQSHGIVAHVCQCSGGIARWRYGTDQNKNGCDCGAVRIGLEHVVPPADQSKRRNKNIGP